jgi:hypothetical protein
MMRFCFFVALLSGCAPTAYEARASRGGYSDTQLGDNLFRIAFEGNGFTSAAVTSDYALLRSAEVALEHAFAFFVVNTGESRAKVFGGENYVGTFPTVINTILCFKDRPAAESTGALVYEAATVRRAMRTKYELNEPQKSMPAAAPSGRSPAIPTRTIN